MTQMFDTAGLSRDGGRTVNMDWWASAEAKGLTCWVLADGLGGHANSQVASELAVETVLNGFRDKPRLDAKALTELFDMANAAVLAKQAEGPELRDIGTTLVVLISDGRRAVWGHVGDLRLYLLRLGGVATQTRDHAAPNGVLLKAIGSKQLKADISGPHRLFRHDAFMLCVDGFGKSCAQATRRVPSKWRSITPRPRAPSRGWRSWNGASSTASTSAATTTRPSRSR